MDEEKKVLEPCPFCEARSGDIDPKGWINGIGAFGPECSHCGATAKTVKLWNKRSN